MLLAGVAAAAAPGIGMAYTPEVAVEARPVPQQAEDREPEANLPYLFAVFIVTWAGFFAYVFIMSRRQREMQREIDTLKRVLAERESPEAGSTQL